MNCSSIRVLLSSLIVCGAAVAFSQTQSAEIPRVIRFQGTLTNVDGSARSGTVGVSFSIYADQQGGAPLWQEVQNVVADTQGHYTVLLGSMHSEGLAADLFTNFQARWLGIRVENEQEQSRVLLAAVPYAMKAADAETLGGKPLSAFVLHDSASGDAGGTSSGGSTTSGTSSLGKLQPTSINTTGSTGTQNFLAMWTDNAGTLGNSTLFQLGSNVGVGTTNPQSLFQVGTDMSFLSNWPTLGYNLYYNGGWRYATSNSGSLVQQDYVNNGLSIFGAGAGVAGNPATINNAMFISSSGGNVGMGTMSPRAPLQIGPDLTLSGAWPSMGYNVYYNGGWKYATANSATLIQQDYSNNGLAISVAPPGTADASVAPTSAMFVSGTANVGIGTTSPAQKLDVAGNINASGKVMAADVISAPSFSGSGASLTSLTAGNLVGSIPGAALLSTSIPAGNLTGSIPSSTFTGTYSNAITLSNGANNYSGNGSNLANVNAASIAGVASSVLNRRLITYLGGCDSCSVLTTSDNQKMIYQNLLGAALTLQAVTCYSDAGTPSINLQRDAGGSTANVTASAIPCSTSGSTVSSFSVTTLNVNDKLNFLMTAPGGTARRVTVIIQATL